MSAPFVPDDAVLAGLAAVLKVAADDLPDLYRKAVSESNRAAAADLWRILAAKGYSAAQILGWDDAKRYNTDQALYWTLVRTGGMGDYSDKFARALDRRDELTKSAVIMVGGVPTPPAGTTGVGGVGYGRVAAADEIADASAKNYFR